MNTIHCDTYGGDGAINFWLAILARGMADTKYHHAKIMREKFEASECYSNNVDSLSTAWWICDYVKGEWCE